LILTSFGFQTVQGLHQEKLS